MITISNLNDLPKGIAMLEIDGELPESLEADFLYITPTKKIRKYFIVKEKKYERET